MQRIITLGYSKRSVAEVSAILDAYNAVLFDIRYVPRSRRPEWNRARLEAALGDRYRHLPALGNLNYKTGDTIKIADYPAGVATLRAHPGNAVLMCVCTKADVCHRTVIANMLCADGFCVEERGEQP